ncbi:hypothetical protein FB451DRAFT_1414862 [Mycena latifolia]|nr:hypothetical protein FB451DRAFT_1414862 [Mycena latifolia]
MFTVLSAKHDTIPANAPGCMPKFDSSWPHPVERDLCTLVQIGDDFVPRIVLVRGSPQRRHRTHRCMFHGVLSTCGAYLLDYKTSHLPSIFLAPAYGPAGLPDRSVSRRIKRPTPPAICRSASGPAWLPSGMNAPPQIAPHPQRCHRLHTLREPPPFAHECPRWRSALSPLLLALRSCRPHPSCLHGPHHHCLHAPPHLQCI